MPEETSVAATHQMELDAGGTSKRAQVGNLYRNAKLITKVQEQVEVVVPSAAMGSGGSSALCLAQTPAGAGNLLMNGSAALEGKWTSASSSVVRQPQVFSSGDLSGVNFTVTGKGTDGQPKTDTKAGPNATYAQFGGFVEVDSISCDGACGSAVTVGFGNPILYLEPGACNVYRVNEGNTNWYVYCNMLGGLSADKVVTGNLVVLKDSTPRSIIFATGSAMTVKTLGSALETGGAGKYVGYAFRAFRLANTLFLSNLGAEA
ncbi:MAG TPA: hypothetical protein DCW68_07230 [Rhodospirillaceae bacterium]|nr:MAG: hypothetical protein A2018_06735 [Alphaproteobacteria bacterium GWF2_58_20]HAU29878.1 hypothetical protein [Rhodospirillaceae bacterium]